MDLNTVPYKYYVLSISLLLTYSLLRGTFWHLETSKYIILRNENCNIFLNDSLVQYLALRGKLKLFDIFITFVLYPNSSKNVKYFKQLSIVFSKLFFASY